MDSADLQFFATVAKVGSISKAALSLDRVQSNVTQRIKRLESKLGVPLFHRHARGVSLTAAGLQLLPYANQIDQMLEEARRVILDDAKPNGLLKLGAMETTAAIRLPALLVDFSSYYPAVDLSLQTGTTQGLIDDVLERRLDAALVAGPVNHADLVSQRILTEELVVVTAPWARRAHQALPWLPEGGTTKIAIFRHGCAYRQKLEALLIRNGVRAIQRMELGTLDGILGCVQAGLAITMLPRAVVAALAAADKVNIYSLKHQQGFVDTILVHRRDAFVTAALSCFVAKALEHAPLANANPLSALPLH
ncbi:HTH-type transcriptional regulator GltR [Pseudomonas fluorescens]|uniref:HTH-type transcriptional regulator GltR n=1 Tax=Pseudomonas fluorescens TaxID=294 RepID=A0A8H2RTF0_PSEFL|nr:LysR substrate-binding domain-containing protein [Pseudomonas fluorescens]VVP15859.1 HTH-type transcriptional regulator GltR [Pseudomonas fluorescens]